MTPAPHKQFPALAEFMGSYFHQDAFVHDPDVPAVVRRFGREAPPWEVRRALDDIDALLSLPLSDADREALIRQTFSGNYFAGRKPLAYTRWMKQVREVLAPCLTWAAALTFPAAKLRAGAWREDVDHTEARLGVRFPPDFVDFLLAWNGGTVHDGRFGFYAIGRHDRTPLLIANSALPETYPLIHVGFTPTGQLGFHRRDLATPGAACPAMLADATTGRIHKEAVSFRDFVTRLGSP